MHRQKRSIPTLDGWRGLAVIGVILYHGRSGFFGNDSILTRVSSHGGLGVDVFFAVSGFLICELLLQESASVLCCAGQNRCHFAPWCNQRELHRPAEFFAV